MDLLYSQIKIWWDELIFFPPPPIIDLTSRLQNPITRLSNRAPTIQLQVQKFSCKTSKVLGP